MAKRKASKSRSSPIKRDFSKFESRVNDVLSDDSKLFAFIATFFSIVGFVIALLARRHDRYVMFYAKQSLIIFIVYLISALAVSIPGFGWIIGPIIYVFAVVLWIVSWIYSISGEFKSVPLAGRYAKMLRFG
jgi:uncharacterized membrane protein